MQEKQLKEKDLVDQKTLAHYKNRLKEFDQKNSRHRNNDGPIGRLIRHLHPEENQSKSVGDVRLAVDRKLN